MRDGDTAAAMRMLKRYPGLVNAKDGAGYPVLFIAIDRGDLAMTKLLASHGAMLTNARYGTAMQDAALDRRIKICRHLHSVVGERVDRSSALQVESIGKIYHLLRQHPKWVRHGPGALKMPLLYWARGRPNVMWLLIGMGANVNAQCGDGRSLVCMFAGSRRVRSLKIVLDAGAYPFIPVMDLDEGRYLNFTKGKLPAPIALASYMPNGKATLELLKAAWQRWDRTHSRGTAPANK